MEKKHIHTIEEIDELKKWFEENRNKLPQTMQLDASTFSPNLLTTIDMLLEQAYVCHKNPNTQGCILLLKKIKKNLDNL